MPKVLIITYYWPPSGGSAVLRWLKFAKYLRDFGWEPVIYTPSNPEPTEFDTSLQEDIPENLEVLKTPIYEPYGIYKWLTGRKQTERLGVALMSEHGKRGLISKMSLWIRSNLFIPDPRMFWIRPSAKYLLNYISKHPVDIVISTGPPHSMHLIALAIKKQLGIKWVADFRDPWTNIDFYHDLLLTGAADRYHKRLEKKVLTGADTVITVSPGMTGEFNAMGFSHVVTITNGYDEEPDHNRHEDPEKFIITHLGSLPKSRNPENLWKALSQLVKKHQEFASTMEIRLVGKADKFVLDSLSAYHLQNNLVLESYIPHRQTMELLARSAVLLLCINNTPNSKGILTNKFFEYLSARRPVVGVGPVDGDAAMIMKETGAGKMFPYDDTESLGKYLLELFNLYSQHKLPAGGSAIDKYSRKNLARQLSELLNKVIH